MAGNRTGAAGVLVFAFLTFGAAACGGDDRVGADTIDKFLADIGKDMAARSTSCPQSAVDVVKFATTWRNHAPVEGALFARAVDAHVSAYTTLCYDAHARAADASLATRKLESANAAYKDWFAALAEHRRK